MNGAGESSPEGLGEFLRNRRARLSPQEAGVVSYGARRVPGLRREELAQLAGISPTYYTRLEQGQSANVSESVIDAIAYALRLDDDECTHLHDLATPVRRERVRRARPQDAQAGTVQLIEAMLYVPAVVMGRRSEILAWNRLGHALLAGHYDIGAPDRPADRPNLTRMLFLDPRTRELYVRWNEEAARAVASLRLIAGRYRHDRELADLVGELTVRSEEFSDFWAKHPVHNCLSGRKLFHHPEIGDLELDFQVLHLPDESGQRVLTYTAPPGTPSWEALRLLAIASASTWRHSPEPEGAGSLQDD